MDNANSREYLDKILVQVLENMRRTIHAPSVQKTDVPRDGLGMNDDDEAALDDEDEDMNPDKRITQRKADQYIEKNGELSDSDDDDENAPSRIPRESRRARLNFRNIMDVGVDSGVETGSGIGTPQQGSSLPDDNDEMNLDADETGNPSPSPAQAPNGSEGASGAVSPRPMVDEDVAMDDVDAAPAPPPAPVHQASAAQDPVVNQGQITPPDSPVPQPQAQPAVQGAPSTATAVDAETDGASSLNTLPPAATSAESAPSAPASTAPPVPTTSATAANDTEAAELRSKMDAEDKAIKAEEEGRMEREMENAAGEARAEAVAKREEEDGPGLAGA